LRADLGDLPDLSNEGIIAQLGYASCHPVIYLDDQINVDLNTPLLAEDE
jgi:hypothetical protein